MLNLDNVIAVRKNKKIYRDGEVVIKVFDADFSKANILNEALNQARVEETGLNIPRILGVNMTGGKWAITLEYIGGKTLEQLMKENPEKREEYLNLFTDLQIKVHAQNAPLLGRLKDKMIRKITNADLDETAKYDLLMRLESMPKHNKVCHGDFNPSNIIIREDGTPFIIDWSHVTQGNASADVARTFLLFSLAGDTETAERYLKMFCEKSGTEIKYVQKWIPIVAASQLVKERPEERELLMKWIHVVDYQ